MKFKKIYTNNAIIMFSLFLGIAGGIFFFPIQLESKYTCLYHRLLDYDHPVQNFIGNTAMLTKKQHIKENTEYEVHSHGQKMLDRYIVYYAVFWWGSIGLVACIIFFRKNLYLETEYININEPSNDK